MNPELKKINAIYAAIQDYIAPSSDYLIEFTDHEQLAYKKKYSESLQLYESTLDQLRGIVLELSPAEIIESYQQGCRLLQRGLSGYMCYRFHHEYSSVMIEAIRKGETHTAHLFMQSLADNMGKEIGPVVIESLNSDSALIRSTALAVARQLDLTNAYTKVEALVSDSNDEVAYLARQILKEWKSKA